MPWAKSLTSNSNERGHHSCSDRCNHRSIVHAPNLDDIKMKKKTEKMWPWYWSGYLEWAACFLVFFIIGFFVCFMLERLTSRNRNDRIKEEAFKTGAVLGTVFIAHQIRDGNFDFSLSSIESNAWHNFTNSTQ